MALSEFEIKRIDKAVAKFMEKRRPPPHIREEVDLSWRLKDQSVELFEIRVMWNDSSRKIESPIAKSTYIKTQKAWKIFWQKRDLKWHGYEPNLYVKRIEDFLAVVDRDEYGCFFG